MRKATVLILMLAFFASGSLRAQEGQDLQATLKNIDQRLAAVESKVGVAPQKEGEIPLRVYWHDTLTFETDNVKVTVGGRIQNDWAFMTQSRALRDTAGIGPFQDGTEFRRARLYVAGLIYEHFEFKAQYDLAGGDADFADVYLGLANLKVDDSAVFGVRVGHFKEPFSLEELTSSRFIPFLERSLPVLAFAPGRNTGVMLHGHCMEGRATAAVGVFHNANTYGNGTNDSTNGGDYDVTARVTYLPYDQEGNLVHVGAAYQLRQLESDVIAYRTTPEAHLAPNVVNTGNINALRTQSFGAEAALVCDRAWVQGEYIHALVRRKGPNRGDPDFGGWYVSGGVFLTGEKKPYKRSSGAFGRVRPKKNFLQRAEDGSMGLGAWEVTGRYSYLDLNDTGAVPRGGILGDVSVGVNWYLNPNVRIMCNYVWADRKARDLGHADLVLLRGQVIF